MSEGARPSDGGPATGLSTALEFPCSGCGQVMAVRYLVPGERAKCKACGAKTVVPDDAGLVEYVPPPPKHETLPAGSSRAREEDVALPPSECPACGHPFTPVPHCVACGYQPGTIRLYNPKYFEHLAVLFTGLVPLWMASSNYKRLGHDGRRRRLLTIGIPFYLVVLAGLMVTPKVTGSQERLLQLGLSLLVNYPVGWYLKRQQLPVYNRFRSLGEGTAPMWKGIIGGGAVLAGVFVAALFLMSPYLDRHMNQGRRLMKKGDYAAAALAFKRALAEDSTDTEAMARAGICEAMSGDLPASASHLRRYLRHEHGNARIWFFLGAVHDDLGDPAAGDSCRRIAARLDSTVVEGR